MILGAELEKIEEGAGQPKWNLSLQRSQVRTYTQGSGALESEEGKSLQTAVKVKKRWNKTPGI